MEQNPYEASREPGGSLPLPRRFRLRTLLFAFALTVPLNCVSFFFLCAAIESPNLDLRLARTFFLTTAMAFIILLLAVLLAMGTRATARHK